MNAGSIVTGVSVAHDHASVDEVEAAAADSERAIVRTLLARDGVEEAFALQTCNRAEAYVVTEDASAGRDALAPVTADVRDGAVVRHDHEAAVRHLMRVASGLESLIVGEDQILGQMKDAAETAREAGGLGPTLEEILLKAVHVGERARTETGINEGTVSLGGAAVELAHRKVDLAGATVLVVGAGEMGTLAARTLADAGVDRLYVANRTRSAAEHVACEVPADADAVGLGAAERLVESADAVIAATAAPDPVLSAEAFVDAGDTVVVDVAQPRDVPASVADIEGVVHHDIDDLETITETAQNRRHEEAAAVEELIDAEFDRLVTSFKRKRADEAVSAMYEGAERVKRREVEEAVTKLEAQGGLTDEQRETVADLADALVGQLLAAPTKSLREAAAQDDWTTIRTAMTLFDPGFDDSPESPDEGAEESPPAGVVNAEDD